MLNMVWGFALIALAGFHSPSVYFTYLNYPLDFFPVFLSFVVFFLPIFKFFHLKNDQRGLVGLFINMCLSIALISFLTSAGVYFSTHGSVIVLTVANLLCLYSTRKNKISLSLSLNDKKLIGLIGIFFVYYSFRYFLVHYQAVPDADTASVLGIAHLQYLGFPHIVNSLPAAIDSSGQLKLSEVFITQSPWIGSFVGTFTLLSHSDLSRVSFWLWNLSLFVFLGSGVSFVLYLLKKTTVKFYTPTLILLVLFFHNRQVHLAYAGGELQELFSLALLYGAAIFLLERRYLYAATCISSSLGFQPDEAFPWAFGLTIFFILSKPPLKKWLEFGLGGLLILSPFLIQQGTILASTDASSWGFVEGYQILVNPYEEFAQFYFPGLLYVLGLLGLGFSEKNNRKFIMVFIFTFLFFSLYPWVIHYLNPENSKLYKHLRYPVIADGTFKDIFIPFIGKYYFFRQSISWFLIPFSFIGISLLLNKTRFQKQLTIGLLILLFGYHIYGHSKHLLHLGPTAIKETSFAYVTLSKKIENAHFVLTPPSNSVDGKPGGYYNWWAGAQLNQISEESRIYFSTSDLIVNSSFKFDSYSKYFWKTVYSGNTNLIPYELDRASKIYSHLVVQDSSQGQTLCTYLKTQPRLNFIQYEFPYCLFKFHPAP